jgi:hypothetical protein
VSVLLLSWHYHPSNCVEAAVLVCLWSFCGLLGVLLNDAMKRLNMGGEGRGGKECLSFCGRVRLRSNTRRMFIRAHRQSLARHRQSRQPGTNRCLKDFGSPACYWPQGLGKYELAASILRICLANLIVPIGLSQKVRSSTQPSVICWLFDESHALTALQHKPKSSATLWW